MTRPSKLIAVAVAVVIVVAGLRACTTSAGPADRSVAGAGAVAASSVPDTGADSSDVTGSAEAADAARSAAVAAVRSTGDVAAAGFITRGDMIRDLATEGFASRLIEESSAQLDAMTVELSEAGIPVGAIRLYELPLTAEVNDLAGSAATVEVWSVTVVTVADHAAPRQLWRTVTVTLAHDDETGNWLVDGWTAVPGPTPALGTNSEVASLDDIEAVLAATAVGG